MRKKDREMEREKRMKDGGTNREIEG